MSLLESQFLVFPTLIHIVRNLHVTPQYKSWSGRRTRWTASPAPSFLYACPVLRREVYCNWWSQLCFITFIWRCYRMLLMFLFVGDGRSSVWLQVCFGPFSTLAAPKCGVSSMLRDSRFVFAVSAQSAVFHNPSVVLLPVDCHKDLNQCFRVRKHCGLTLMLSDFCCQTFRREVW